jgi:hypothetical protein
MARGRGGRARLWLSLALPALFAAGMGISLSGYADGWWKPGQALPDLAVRRDGFAREGDTVRIVVENRGAGASPATEIELVDGPFASGSSARESPYLPVDGERAIWIAQQPDGDDAIRLDLAFGTGVQALHGEGTLTVAGAGPLSIVASAKAGVEARLDAQEKTVSLELGLPALSATQTMSLRVPIVNGGSPRAHLFLDPERTDSLPQIVTPSGVLLGGEAELLLDCLEKPRGQRARAPVPPLAPGARTEIRTEFGGGALGELSVWCDPEDRIEEVREGNNVACWRADAEWSLAALHIHSCFSEGAGSFDWQVWQACRSGYDLVWWSEHDWRMSCVDHDEILDFAEDGPARARFSTSGGKARSEFVAAGELAGGRVLRLATSGEGRSIAAANLGSDRKRFTYALASRVDVTPRVFARSFGPGDVLTIGFDLSLHPGERRRLLYRFTGGGPARGSEPTGAAAAAEAPWGRIFVETLPSGGWLELPLHLSRDAEMCWPNGLDNSLVGIWFELDASGEAEVLIDRIGFRHEDCGTALVEVQKDWVAEYPNICHEIGGEVSYDRPHMGRYGGDPGFVGYDNVWETDRVNIVTRAVDVVRRVHGTGGLVSWCHPFGSFWPSGSALDRGQVRMYESPLYWRPIFEGAFGGVDILEVGYRERAGRKLPDYLALWDRAAAADLLLTGIGVSDSHSIQWGSWENNFGTWLQAPANDAYALLRALRSGRAVFGDPLRFRGRVELRCGESEAGDVLTGGGPREVEIRLAAIGEGRTVRLVADGVLLREWTDVSADTSLSAQLSPGAAQTVRAEVWDENGEPLAFTNPLYFDREGGLQRR